MIHTANLIAKREDYTKMNYNERKQIFSTLFYFTNKANIKIKSFIINKRYKNTKLQLKAVIMERLLTFFKDKEKYFNSFDKILIYYDNGQQKLGSVLNIIFDSNPRYQIISEFDHTKERLFQVTDMLTVIDKLDYRKKNKMPLNKQEIYFINRKDLRRIIRLLSKKRL